MMSQNESGEAPLPLDAPRTTNGRRRLNMLDALHSRGTGDRGPLRRGVYLLPSFFTLGNLFCGYACIMYAMRGDLVFAAPFIGVAVVLDMLDGRIARLTGTSSAFGREFDSMADLVSFGVAPAILAYVWGLQPLHRLGWATGFIFITAAAMRLARFNIQSVSATDKRYFAGMPSPAAAALPASTVYFYPEGFSDPRSAIVALLVVLVPAILMVTTIRFRSFKTIDLQARRSYKVLALLALVIALVQLEPRIVLILIAYVYLVSAFIEMAWARLRRRPTAPSP